MIYNDLQDAVLLLLDQTHNSMEDSLESLVQQHSGEADLYARLIAALTNLELDEAEARSLFTNLLNHHREFQVRLGRDVDLRVTSMDYLIANEVLGHTPTIVSSEMLQLTQRLAAVDEITGLFNRRFLETYLTKELNRARRYDQVFSLLFLDLDDFKKINDSFGHSVGDQVLAGLGRQITDLLRHEDFAARYGGEEFVVILPQTTEDGALAFGERLRESLARLDLVPGVQVTFSAGVASYPRHGLSGDDLLQRADAALYSAKLAGKDQTLISDAEKRSTARYRADIPVVAYAGNAELGALRLCDVSAGGYALVSNDVLKPGQMLRVRIHSEDGARPQEYEVLAHVLWSRRVGSDGPYRSGGQWDPPHSDAAEQFVKSVASRQAV